MKTTMIPYDAMAAFTRLKSMPEIRAMRTFRAHGRTSVYGHSIGVTNLSLWLAKRFRLEKSKYHDLILAAMLHDFYLYDYHGQRLRNGPHAWRHPETALKNAAALFDLGPVAREAIRCHMFPGTLLHMPLHAVGWIVSLADKICAIYELCRSEKMQRIPVAAYA